jgi:hypothetical protein
MKTDFSLDDLTKSALKRLVGQLLAADEGQEKKILNQLNQKKRTPEKNDLADLDEEMHGKPETPEVEEDEEIED